MRLGTTVCVAVLTAAFPLRAFAINITPTKDNTLIESGTGALSNGLGDIYVGRTNQPSGSIRRGLVHFDVAGNIPACSTIDTATLSLYLTMAPPAGPNPYTYYVYKVGNSWGEGTSFFGGGQGAPSTPGDATWIHRVCSTGTPCTAGSTWAATGGDFAGTASASLSIGATTLQYYTWSGGTLVNDVQGWLDSPSTNYGWGIMDDAATAQSARRFSSHEQASNKPILAVTYTPHSCLRGNTVDIDVDGLGMKPFATADLGAGEARLYVDKMTGEVTAVPTDLGAAAKRTIVRANGKLHFISVKQFDGETTSSMVLRDLSTDDLVVAKETDNGLSLRVLPLETDPSDELALPAKGGANAADAGGCSASPGRAADLGGVSLLAVAAVLTARRRRRSVRGLRSQR